MYEIYEYFSNTYLVLKAKVPHWGAEHRICQWQRDADETQHTR